MVKRGRQQPVDYWRQQQARRRLAHYLKAGSFRKIAGTPIFGRKIMHRRVWLAILTVIIFAVGFGFVIW